MTATHPGGTREVRLLGVPHTRVVAKAVVKVAARDPTGLTTTLRTRLMTGLDLPSGQS
jgi:hypothetical protein